MKKNLKIILLKGVTEVAVGIIKVEAGIVKDLEAVVGIVKDLEAVVGNVSDLEVAVAIENALAVGAVSLESGDLEVGVGAVVVVAVDGVEGVPVQAVVARLPAVESRNPLSLQKALLPDICLQNKVQWGE